MQLDSIIILLLGIATVIGGVMLLRLHAFLALLAGAFVIAQLTPSSMIETSYLNDKYITVKKTGDFFEFFSQDGKFLFPVSGEYQTDLKDENEETVTLNLIRNEVRMFASPVPYYHELQLSKAFADYKLPKEFTIVSMEDIKAANKQVAQAPIDRIATGLGKTFTQIGIMIAMAAILGQCMLLNGSALKIVTTIRESLGERNTTLAFVMCSFILAVPVYFDTVFYLMLPLAKAMAQQTKKDYLKYVISIVVGGTLAHSLVPPTPGPLLVSEKLNVNIATMFLMGSIVSILGICIGYIYMNVINKFVILPIPEVEVTDEDQIGKHKMLPPFWLAILPILFPVFTIGLQATWKSLSRNIRHFFLR